MRREPLPQRLRLQAQFGQPWMVIGPATQGPTKESVCFFDEKIVDAGVPNPGKTRGIKLPVFIAIRPMPLPGIVVRFVGETDSDPVPFETPQLLDKAVVQFCRPLPFEKGNYLGSAV